MRIKKNIALSDSGFIFNPTTGDSFSTNPIGLEILKLARDGKTHDDIKTHVLDLYTVDDATFEKDFYDFVSMLQTMGIVEADET